MTLGALSLLKADVKDKKMRFRITKSLKIIVFFTVLMEYSQYDRNVEPQKIKH